MGNIWKNCNFSCYATRIPSPSCAAWAAWAWPFFQVMDRHQVCKPWLPWTTWPWTTWLWWVVAGQMAVMLGRCWKMDSNPEDFFWTGTSQNRGYDGYECHLQILGNPFRNEVTYHFFLFFLGRFLRFALTRWLESAAPTCVFVSRDWWDWSRMVMA